MDRLCAGILLPMKLCIGEREFTASRAVLQESDFFRAIFEKNRFEGNRLYIDLDGDIFEHILRYLRTGIFPMLWNKRGGHDYATYLLIQTQANMLLLNRLETWLREQRYLNAVKVYITSEISEEEVYETAVRAGEADVTINTIISPENNYVCPRGVDAHHEHPELCTDRCTRTPPIGGNLWRRTWDPMDVVVRRKYVFSDTALIDYGHWQHKLPSCVGGQVDARGIPIATDC